MENNAAAGINHKTSAGSRHVRDKHDGEDSEDDEDEDRDEPVIVTTSVADSCSASHEFEWLSPGYQNLSYTPSDKHNDRTVSTDAAAERQQLPPLDEGGVSSCQVSPAHSAHHRHHKPPYVWPRKSSEIAEQARMSPSPCHELHACHRHLSPMRSSWCCPSPSPHSVCLHHHGGSMVSGLELVSYNRDCAAPDISIWPCQNCSCLPPTGLTTQSRYQESHSWCQMPSPHHEILRRESSSPCAVHKPCQGFGGSRRSRSARKRDCISPLSPRYSPVPGDQTTLRHSGHDQWQVPVHSEDIDSLQKVQELESDKKNLLLQASVLADQVDAQADKIIELERLLQQKKDELLHLEQNLHQEIIGRSTVENNKLELMTELSNLRLRLNAAERDRKDSEDKCRKLEHELALCQACLLEKESEYAALKDKLSRFEDRMLSNESSEIEKLKSALDSIVIASDKDQKLGDLQSSLTRYRKIQDIVLSSQSHLRKTASGSDSHIFNHESVLCSANNDALKKLPNDSNIMKSSHAPQSLTSLCTLSTYYDQSVQPSFTCSTKVLPNINSNSTFHKSNSVENICPSSLSAFPTKSQYGTMPRQTGSQVLQQLQTRLQEHEADQKKSQTLPSDKSDIPLQDSVSTASKSKHTNGASNHKSASVSFATECVTIPVEKRSADQSPDSGTTPQPFLIKSDKEKNKGIKKFFSRWKRTGSQNIDRLEDFKRGGIRATAGPRLGWSRDLKNDPDFVSIFSSIPFNRWNTDMVVDWLHKLGLSMYISDCKRWMCNGEILSKATSQDFEKELNMKHPLHRKKLILAVKSVNNNLPNLPSSINSIDCEWVFRWLDDIGLPQYKDAFAEALVDGRMLHYLTIDDLLYLKVTSQLHHISIKCGIQVLREKGFDPHCLVRRSLPEESKVYVPEMVALWTNHRVMEWLRTVDLSEYAPNLRGSGVHGALIVFESKFNTNLFATLLNIPPTKTLLRRHLATHFKHIVGDELMQIKREKETEVPLSPSFVKIKVMRKSQFALKKKRNKSEFENEDYVCPMDIEVCNDQVNHVPKALDGEKLVVRRNSDPSPQERHMDMKDETTERIGNKNVSKDISSIANILHGENLSGSPSTIV